MPGTTGGIFRYDFGKRGQTPEPFLAPTASGGMNNAASAATSCRATAQKMTYGNDDADSDDEYGDLNVFALDVATKVADGDSDQRRLPGVRARPLALPRVATARQGNAEPNQFGLFDGNSGAAATPSTVSSG